MASVTRIATASGQTVSFAPSMRMTCTCGNEWPVAWCRHRTEILTEGLDTEGMWRYLHRVYDESPIDPREADQHAQTAVFNSPVVPTLGLFADITAECINRSMFSLHLNSPDTGEIADDRFLGILSEGDGLNVTRALVARWFKQKHDPLATCNATAHGWQATERIANLVQLGNQPGHPVHKGVDVTAELFVIRWNLYWSGMCTMCLDFLKGDDLIPDIGTPARSAHSVFANSKKFPGKPFLAPPDPIPF